MSWSLPAAALPAAQARAVLEAEIAVLRPRRNAVTVVAGAFRYSEPALVVGAAGVWLNVLAVTVRGLG